jgi:hypothetical protein
MVPESLLRGIIIQPLDPFNQEGYIRDSSICDPKATLVLRLADLLPVHLMLLALVASAFPEKPTSMLVKPCMSPV